MGYADKHLLFGGAGGKSQGNPWGTLGLIVARALEPLGYTVDVNPEAALEFNARMVGDGAVDFGAVRSCYAHWAYEGTKIYEGEPPRRSLRNIASILHPCWEGVAIRWETGITDLSQIRERRLPIRVIAGTSPTHKLIWAHYELDRALIESYGGKFQEPIGKGRVAQRPPWVRTGDFDVIMQPIHSGWAPEMWNWYEATMHFNLRFLPLPDELIQKITREISGTVASFIPRYLFRGLWDDVPSVDRVGHIVYGRDDMPDDFAYLLAKALDDGRHLFRQTHLAFAYDTRAVAQDIGIPMHPGAERYYREMGYLPT
jgi:uncharacterized protein